MKDNDERKFAAALQYDRKTDGAPRISAKGRGELAERIIDIARREGIAITEDKDLAVVISAMEVGEEIPPELYSVVAEIFSFLYRMNNQMKAVVSD